MDDRYKRNTLDMSTVKITDQTKSIKDGLNRLADMEAQLDVIRIRYQELENSIVPDEIKQKLEEIRAERDTALKSAEDGIEIIRKSIKMAVEQLGERVDGEHMQAIFIKGRVSWDTDALNRYAGSHPEILNFRKIGNPSVTIRRI